MTFMRHGSSKARGKQGEHWKEPCNVQMFKRCVNKECAPSKGIMLNYQQTIFFIIYFKKPHRECFKQLYFTLGQSNFFLITFLFPDCFAFSSLGFQSVLKFSTPSTLWMSKWFYIQTKKMNLLLSADSHSWHTWKSSRKVNPSPAHPSFCFCYKHFMVWSLCRSYNIHLSTLPFNNWCHYDLMCIPVCMSNAVKNFNWS